MAAARGLARGRRGVGKKTSGGPTRQRERGVEVRRPARMPSDEDPTVEGSEGEGRGEAGRAGERERDGPEDSAH